MAAQESVAVGVALLGRYPLSKWVDGDTLRDPNTNGTMVLDVEEIRLGRGSAYKPQIARRLASGIMAWVRSSGLGGMVTVHNYAGQPPRVMVRKAKWEMVKSKLAFIQQPTN